MNDSVVPSGLEIVGVVPARYASSRFPGKVLTPIRGIPMISLVVANLRRSNTLNRVVVATDDPRVASAAVDAGAEVVMTDPALPSGSDRVWAAIRNERADIVVNVQADEPLLPATVVDSLVGRLLDDDSLDVATPVVAVSAGTARPSDVVTVACADDGTALYFSRSTIPAGADPVWRHVGVYAYRRQALERFVLAPRQELERTESLEQLRAVAIGLHIGAVPVAITAQAVDRPADVALVEQALDAMTGEAGDAPAGAVPWAAAATRIRLVVLDVDGVMTDGRVSYAGDRDQVMSFDIKDGYGVVALVRAGVQVAVMSGRDSPALRRRTAELGITAVRTEVVDKARELAGLCTSLGVLPEHTCFVGDDDPDVEAMAMCAMSAAPADASPRAIAQATLVLRSRGGRGAVRELADLLLAGIDSC